MKFKVGDKVQLSVDMKYWSEFAEHDIYPFKPYVVTFEEPWNSEQYIKFKHLKRDISAGSNWFKFYKQHIHLYKYILSNEI